MHSSPLTTEDNTKPGELLLPEPVLRKYGAGSKALIFGWFVQFRHETYLTRSRTLLGLISKRSNTPIRTLREALYSYIEDGFLREEEDRFVFLDEQGNETNPGLLWKTKALYLPEITLALKVKELSYEGRIIYAAILRYSRMRNGKCEAAVASIARSSQASERSVQHWLRELHVMGAIRITLRGNAPHEIFAEPDPCKWRKNAPLKKQVQKRKREDAPAPVSTDFQWEEPEDPLACSFLERRAA